MKEAISMEETLAAAETFRKQVKRLITNFDQNYVINTDQTGMQTLPPMFTNINS